MEPTRRFDDREIALIFERAGHLQESTQANPGDVAWAQLVGSMRETFDARGRLESDGVTGAMASNAATPAAAIFAACGAAFLAATAVSVPRWARTRASQMDSIAVQAGRLVGAGQAERAVGTST